MTIRHDTTANLDEAMVAGSLTLGSKSEEIWIAWASLPNGVPSIDKLRPATFPSHLAGFGLTTAFAVIDPTDATA